MDDRLVFDRARVNAEVLVARVAAAGDRACIGIALMRLTQARYGVADMHIRAFWAAECG